jgi:RNA polymerase sigma-70 factor, ECF subfamily
MLLPAGDRDTTDRDRTERAWVKQIRTGDERAFEALFRRYVGPLCAFARSYVTDQEIAEELVEDVFAWIWEHRFTFDMPRAVHAYLYGAVRNRAISWLRHTGAATALIEEGLHEPMALGDVARPVAADEGAEAADVTDALSRALRDMPLRCREVFTLTRYHHLTYAQVADVLGISPKTVEIHMSRALAILRIRLKPWLEG